MPSIPQSLLWIALVVLWLFVLVPMLINKRDTIRRTSDVALATRVINSAAKSRLIRRGGPATGHRHDPDWQLDDESDEDYSDQQDDVEEYDDAVRAARAGTRTSSVLVVTSVTEEALTEPVYIDVDVVDENSGALPVGNGVQESLFDANARAAETGARAFVGSEPVAEYDSSTETETMSDPEPAVEPVAEADPQDGTADDYEYIDDTSGLEAEDDQEPVMAPRRGNRQRRLESTTAAEVSARKYRFRKRVLMAMSTIMVATAAVAFTVGPAFWWACGTSAVVTLLYLGYLRRQTRIEEQVRRRRQQRMARSRPEFERDSEFRDTFRDTFRDPQWRAPARRGVDTEEFGSRYQRAGAAVLDIDDEDPVFEHLDEVPYSRRYDLPRAAGQ
ncbi:MAG: gephyrin-like molybdotransferase receptor GlpR [Mycobacterium sp.]|jgi:membrane protein implicated in regulation of membrane protease activity